MSVPVMSRLQVKAKGAFKAASFVAISAFALSGTAEALDEAGATGIISDGFEDTSGLTPTEAAQEEWRRMVCDGLVTTSYQNPSDLNLAPSGTLMPPSLHPSGFTDAWYASVSGLEPTTDEVVEPAEEVAAKEETSPTRRYLSYAAAFGLPALGFFILGKRRRRSGWVATYAFPLALALPVIASIALLSATARAGVDSYLGDDIRLAGGSLDDWRSFLCDDDIMLAAGGGFGVPTDLVNALQNRVFRGFDDPGSGGFPGPPSFFPLATNFGGISRASGSDEFGDTSVNTGGGLTSVSGDVGSGGGTGGGSGGTPGGRSTGGGGGSGGGGGGGAGPTTAPVPLPPTLWLMLTACGGMVLGSAASRTRRQNR